MKKLLRSALCVAVLGLVALPGALAAELPKTEIFAKYDAKKAGKQETSFPNSVAGLRAASKISNHCQDENPPA